MSATAWGARFAWARGLARRDFARSVAVLAFGTLLGNGLNALISPVLTRLYGPGDMGRAGLFTAFINIASAATALRYELAVVSTDTVEEAATLVLGSLIIAVPMSVLLGGVLYGLITFGLIGFQVLPVWAAVIAPVTLLLATAFFVFRFWFIRDGKFADVSRVFVGQNATRTGVQTAAGFRHAGWAGLFAGDLIGRFVAVAVLVSRSRAALLDRARTVSRADFRRVFVRYREFPIVSLPSTMLDMLALNLPLPLIVRSFGVDSGGYFALVQLVFALPLSLIGGSIGDAFHGHVAEFARTDRARVRPFFIRTTKLLFVCGIGPLVLLAIFGPSVLGFVFGSKWGMAGRIAAVMTPWALGQLVVSPVSRIVFVVQGQRAKLVYDALNLALVGGTFVVAGHLRLSLLATMGLMSVLQFGMYGVYYLLLLGAISRFEVRGLAANAMAGEDLLGGEHRNRFHAGTGTPRAVTRQDISLTHRSSSRKIVGRRDSGGATKAVFRKLWIE